MVQFHDVTGTGFNVDSEIWKRSDKDNGAIIESNSEIKFLHEVQDHIHV